MSGNTNSKKVSRGKGKGWDECNFIWGDERLIGTPKDFVWPEVDPRVRQALAASILDFIGQQYGARLRELVECYGTLCPTSATGCDIVGAHENFEKLLWELRGAKFEKLAAGNRSKSR
jgi:hypothetical protein